MTIQTAAKQLTRTTKYKLNNGNWIPAAGFGVYLLEPENCYQLVYEALLQGYRHIDTAMGYGNQKDAARAVADFVQKTDGVSREDIWFTTKISNASQGYDEAKLAVQKIADDVKEYIGYVDLILIHSPLTSKKKRVGTWKALQEYVLDPNNSTLVVHSIGVSNFGEHHIEELLHSDGVTIKPVINQIELHPWLPKLKLREYLTKQNIVIEAYSPLTQGVKLDDPELLALEKKFNVSKIEILAKWAYLQGFVVLLKTANKSRVKQNFEILPPGKESKDALDEGGNLGKIDLDLDLLDALDKLNTGEVFCWNNTDPTENRDEPE
ncbi:hypothetical protein PUMCH_002885 [Australozyma saopauloensis]|uniref:2-dehydropantolactone reductase n=1 Tax=Australozyma saopauloensis TaxID=291208 RepID=A0AAX4HAK2_9ASCO|nr:hypothetical protein PUMCH_002885 [[Candida] saopauloensis]